MEKIKRIQCGNGNCFLVYGENNAILVDTCRTGHREKILDECINANVSLIVLTHGHIDHAANAAYLSRVLDVPIAMHKNDYELTKNNMAERMSAHTILGKLVLALTMQSFKKEKIEAFEPAFFLQDRDRFESYGVDAEVIDLPGHTKGSIGIRVGADDLIVGDALMNLFYPTISMLYGDYSEVKKSAEIIRQSKVKRIHFGHGKSVPNQIW